MKTCTKCRRDLDEGEFYREARFKCGLSPWCKKCKDACSTEAQRRARRQARELRLNARANGSLIPELVAEEEYLIERLAMVRRWLARLARAAAVTIVACAAPPPREPVSEIDLAVLLPQVARATISTGAPSIGKVALLRRRCEDRDGGAPLLMCAEMPRAGRKLKLICWAPGGRAQSLAISMNADELPDGTPLPQPVRGAPDCLVEVPHDSLTPIGSGRAEVTLILPPGSAGSSVFMQSVVFAPGENQAGVLTSRGYRMVIGL